jgi:TFIIH basal transcription factor complex TTD-A subunit
LKYTGVLITWYASPLLDYSHGSLSNLILIISVRICCSDPAVKQILLQLDESSSIGRFIISDLDDTHLLIAPDYVDKVQEELELELEKNHFAQGGDEE